MIGDDARVDIVDGLKMCFRVDLLICFVQSAVVLGGKYAILEFVDLPGWIGHLHVLHARISSLRLRKTLLLEFQSLGASSSSPREESKIRNISSSIHVSIHFALKRVCAMHSPR